MSFLISFTKKHALALLFAAFVGLLSVAPSVLAPLALGGDYEGLQFLYLDDETTYRSRIHEVLDGYPGVSSPFLYEYKDATSVVPPINEYFYVIPALFFGLSGAIIFAKFFFPTLLFLLIYLLVYLLLSREDKVGRYFAAIATGILVTLGYDLVDYSTVIGMFKGAEPATHLLLWTRLVNPISGVLITFSVLLVAWRMFTAHSRYLFILLGILLSLGVGYFFTLAICYAIVGLIFLVTLHEGDYRRAGLFGASLALSILIDIPYWLTAFTTLGGTEGAVAAAKNGMEFTHEAIVNKLLLISTIFVAGTFFYSHRKEKSTIVQDKKVWQFLAILLLSGWLAFNQQIITGRMIWPAHFVQYTIPFIILAVIVSSELVWRKVFPKIWKGTLILVIGASVIFGVHSANSYAYKLSEFRHLQMQYGELFLFLNKFAARECVIMVQEFNEELERLIPAYTNCNVYNTQYSYSVPSERVLHNFLLRMRLEEVKPSLVSEYLFNKEIEVRGYFFENWGQMYMSTQGRDLWLDQKVSYIEEAYARSLAESLDSQMRKYKIDYLYAEKLLSEDLLRELPGVTIATSTNEFVLYRVTQ